VAHGLMDLNRMLRGWRQQPLQRRIGQLAALFQSFFEHDG